MPEEHGGGSVSGDGLVDAVLMAVERGKFVQPGPFVATNVVAYALATAGSDAHRKEVLPALIAGEAAATWAMADPSGEIGTGVIATPAADGYVLTGSKGLVPEAASADWILVTAARRRRPGAGVAREGDGGRQRHRPRRPRPHPSLRSRRLRRAEVPPSAVVGDAGAVAGALERQLQLAVVLTVAESVGAMDHLFGEAVEYAKARTAFGRPIGSFQAVKHLLADTSLWLETSKAVVASPPRGPCRPSGDDAVEIASMAKAYVGDCGIELAQNCLQVFGGIGFTWEHDLHLYLRRLTTDASLYGEPAWHRERVCRIHGL